jgi:CheY-like chemotaxis protein
MPHGGKLSIKIDNAVLDQRYVDTNPKARPGEYVVVSISDTGTGMSKEVLEHAFEPFYTTKKTGQNSGLGLSMVYGFVTQSQGHIKITSAPDSGTEVNMYLPKSLATPARQAFVHEALELAGGTENILLVEDNDMVRTHAENVLTGLGYLVKAACNGREALEYIKRGGACDLLLSDVVMPGGMNGPQLAIEVEKLRPGMPVLFSSGYMADEAIRQENVDAALYLLRKPYDRSTLAWKVRSALDRKQGSAK